MKIIIDLNKILYIYQCLPAQGVGESAERLHQALLPSFFVLLLRLLTSNRWDHNLSAINI